MVPSPSTVRKIKSPLPPVMGKVGVGMACLGTLIAMTLQISAVMQGQFVSLGLLLGSAIYTLGAFLAAATYGFERGTALSIFFTVCRLLIFGTLMFGVMNIQQ